MTRLDAAIARIRRDHADGRITSGERAALVHAARQAVDAHRDPFNVLDEHARMRGR